MTGSNHQAAQALLEELGRVATSDDFRSKPAMVKMLSYLVNEVVEGRAEQIKAYSIAVDVFAQSGAFDPNDSALVRNNAVRLRALLKTYYLGEGRDNPLMIEIPKGRYVPHAVPKEEGSVDSSAPRPVATARSYQTVPADLPSICVPPFRVFGAEPDPRFAAIGLAQALSDTLTRYEVRVIGCPVEPGGAAGDWVNGTPVSADVDYWVLGDVVDFSAELRVNLRLSRGEDREQVWACSVNLDRERGLLVDFEDLVVERIANSICGEYGLINQPRMRALLESKPNTPGEQELMLRHYHHVTVMTPESMAAFEREVTALLKTEPDSALVNACAAGLYSNIWTFAYPGADDAFEKFKLHAEKAFAINPNNHWALGSIAFKCFVCDERERFFQLFDSCEASLTSTPLSLGGWACWICHFGEWDRGKAILDRVIDSNLYVPGWLYGPGCLYSLRLEDYETALQYATKIQIPGLFWGPLLRACVLAHLGRRAEAESEYAALLELVPDFEEKRSHLVECMIKDRGLIDQLYEGLSFAGGPAT